jgi:BolA protein
MDINELIAIVKKKLTDQIDIERIEIEDKSFLHKNHAGNQEGRYHLKIIMSSSELKSLSRVESNKRVYKILDKEMKEHIHSIQILIS